MKDKDKIRELLINYISKFNFSALMKVCGHTYICIVCKNFKWITAKECDYNWGWKCIKKHNLAFGTCKGNDFIPKDSFLKELKEVSQ